MDTDSPISPGDSREQTTPFLIRTFVKIGGFHRLTQFEDGLLPTTDEQQLFTWKDATLREVLTILRTTAPHVAEYKHPLARFQFRVVYADSTNKGRYAQKELGMVYSRDILGEPGSLDTTAPRLLEEFERPLEGDRAEKTLHDLGFVPGDFLCVAVLLKKSITAPSDISIKGAALPAPTTDWRKPSGDDASLPPPRKEGWGSSRGGGGPPARGGGHWRGGSTQGPGGGRGSGRGDRGDRDRERDRDPRIPPPRRNDYSPPPPTRGAGAGGRGRGRRSPSPSRSVSRSRSPPRRRSRYD